MASAPIFPMHQTIPSPHCPDSTRFWNRWGGEMEVFEWLWVQGKGRMGGLMGRPVNSLKNHKGSLLILSSEGGCYRLCIQVLLWRDRILWGVCIIRKRVWLLGSFSPQPILGCLAPFLFPPTLVHWGMKLGWGQATWLTEGWEGETHCIWKGVLSKRH